MNKNEMKELNLEEEEKVAAGTVSECTELGQAYVDCKAADGLIGIGTHVPLTNIACASELESALSDEGIKADLSVGFLGTGIGSKPNKYYRKDNGQELSHQEVLNILKQK